MTAKELQKQYGAKSETELLGLLVLELEEFELYKSEGKFQLVVVCGIREFCVEAETVLEAFVKMMEIC
jgi:hypothetical protein